MEVKRDGNRKRKGKSERKTNKRSIDKEAMNLVVFMVIFDGRKTLS